MTNNNKLGLVQLYEISIATVGPRFFAYLRLWTRSYTFLSRLGQETRRMALTITLQIPNVQA
jgi:hypothetical protein